MSEKEPTDLDRFEAKLKAARGKIEGDRKPDSEAAPAYSLVGMAMRVSIELVVGLAVGLGMGWLIDRWLGTRPWFMLGMMFVGVTAGILNVRRMAIEIDRRNAEEANRKK